MGLRTSADMPPARALVAAMSVLALSGITSFAGNAFIASRFPDRPRPHDLLLDVLPASTIAQYVTEVTIISSFVVLLAYGIRYARTEIPGMVAVFGIMYLIRSVLMVLTPFASAYTGSEHFGMIPLDQLGMFPSGHVAASLLCMMLIDSRKAPALKRLALALMLAQWIALVLSHAHYSIDIAGGILLGLFVHREWQYGSLFGPVKMLMGYHEKTATDSAAA
ncbi:MAG: phosphatase PAP2-related protein [Anaerosomatales bacterium]